MAQPDGVVADVANRRIIIYVSDENAAYEIADAFGRHDGFHDEVMAAANEVWPGTELAPEQIADLEEAGRLMAQGAKDAAERFRDAHRKALGR